LVQHSVHSSGRQSDYVVPSPRNPLLNFNPTADIRQETGNGNGQCDVIDDVTAVDEGEADREEALTNERAASMSRNEPMTSSQARRYSANGGSSSHGLLLILLTFLTYT